MRLQGQAGLARDWHWPEREAGIRRTFELVVASVVLAAAATVFLGAAPSAQAQREPDSLAGGVLATFDVSGELFSVWVTNPTTIQQLIDLEKGTSPATIPNGRIVRGPGQDAHNEAWSWHLDPQDIEMAEVTIEVCDATPSFVEENLDYFVDVVKRYCPWAAVLVDLEDFR